jgi:dynein heavy chain
VAGGFKRAEPELPEDSILMRALRDFNIPKIAFADLSVFYGLLGDLFPGVDPPRKRDIDFEKIIRDMSIESKLYPEEEFILKVV